METQALKIEKNGEDGLANISTFQCFTGNLS